MYYDNTFYIIQDILMEQDENINVQKKCLLIPMEYTRIPKQILHELVYVLLYPLLLLFLIIINNRHNTRTCAALINNFFLSSINWRERVLTTCKWSNEAKTKEKKLRCLLNVQRKRTLFNIFWHLCGHLGTHLSKIVFTHCQL